GTYADVDSDPLTAVIVDTPPSSGRLHNTNTSLDYGLASTITRADLDAGYVVYRWIGAAGGTDAFTYSVSDGTLASAVTGTMNVTLTGNTAPVLGSPSVNLNENSAVGAVVMDLDAFYTDPDGPVAPGFTITSGNTHNAFSINAANELVVNNADAIDAEFISTFMIGVNASDGLASDDGTITVNITDVAGESVISGRVLEDVNADSDISTDGVAFEAGVVVRLFRESGAASGADSADVEVRTFTTTDATGFYSFDGISGDDYYVVVDSTSIVSAVGLNNAAADRIWAEQTYGVDGSLRTVGGVTTYTTSSGELYGGRNAQLSDNTTSIDTVEHITRVQVVTGISSINRDFGFSFNVVTNTLSTSETGVTGDHDATADRTVQGSLRQFIQNANEIVGANHMRFVPVETVTAGSWYQLDLTDALPAINDSFTTIDGTAWSTTNAGLHLDPNAGLVGTGGTVGVDGVTLSQVSAPELELNGGNALAIGLNVLADNVTIRGLAIHGFGDDTAPSLTTGNVVVGGATVVNGTMIESNLIGTAADGSQSGTVGTETTNVLVRRGTNGTITNNIVAHSGASGIQLNGSATLGWSITNNEVYDNAKVRGSKDGVEIASDAGNAIVSGNLIEDNSGGGIDTYASIGNNTFTNNTVRNNGVTGPETAGIRLFGLNSTVERNIIHANAGDGVLVVATSATANSTSNQNRISRNSFQDNVELAIDLGSVGSDQRFGDEVDTNTGKDLNAGNHGIDAPQITVAQIAGTATTITGTGPADSEIELYIADSDVGDLSNGKYYGEGVNYVGTATSDAAGNFTLSTSALSAGDTVTAIAIDSDDNTSEFSANRVVNSRLVAHLAFDETTGTLAADSSPNGNDGAVIGTPGWTDGDIGGGFDSNFNDGIEYVEIPASKTTAQLNQADYAISAWFRPDSLPPKLDTPEGGAAGNDNRYAIVTRSGYHTGISYLDDGRFQLEHWLGEPGSATSVVISSADKFLPGEYFHVVGTIDAINGRIDLYVNGELQGTTTYDPALSAFDYGTDPWLVGIANPDAYTAGVEDFGWAADGSIDDVRLFSESLTSADIDGLYKLGNDGPTANDDTYTTTEDTGFDTADDWHDAGWTERRTLTLDNSALTSDLTDFPILVALDSTRIDYALTLPNGQDLRFVDAGGNLLSHEIESWDSNGLSYVWVKLPVFAATDASYIHMYYGNATASPVGNVVGEVWSNGYEATYHFNEDPASTAGVISESATGLDATANNLVAATGVSGGALHFDGSSSYLDIGSNVPLVDATSGITASAWVHLDDITSAQNIHAISIDGGMVSRFELAVENGEVHLRLRPTDTDPAVVFTTTSTPLVTGTWQQIAVTVDLPTDTVRIFVNGIEQTTSIAPDPFPGFASTTTPTTLPDKAVIGTNESLVNRFIDGRLDEVRLSNVARSAEWIAAQYAAQDNQLLTFSSAQTAAGVQTNDIDPERQTVSTSLVTGPTNAASFTLRADGSFEYTPTADFNGTDSFRYQFTDVYGESDIALVTINVTAVNDAPTSISIDNLFVPENSPAAVIGSFTTTDVDAGDTHTYTVSDSRFEVVGNQLQLKAGQSLNFETEPTVTMTVTTEDQDGLKFTRSGTLTVTDKNDAPTAISLSSTDIDENDIAGIVGFVSVTDEDAADTFTYDVSDPRFEFDGNILKLKDGEVLDHETEPTVTLTVKAADSATAAITRIFTIDVNDLNETPSLISLSNSTVTENSPAAVIGTLTTSDVDDADAHTYTVDDSRFEVVADQLKLRAGESLDHETEDTVTLQITSTDNGTLSVTNQFKITVDDINETPTAIALDSTGVDENSVEAIIGNLTTSDVDDSDTHTYTVDDSRFEVVAGQLKLRAGESLDHETEDTVTIQITSTDNGTLSVTNQFEITVDDINETPTAVVLDNTDVDENSDAAIIGNLTTDDVDNLDSHTYTVSDSRFEIDGSTLQLKSGESLDHETEPTVTLTVTSTDSGGIEVNSQFTIDVGDTNETPAAIDIDNATIAENTGGVIGQLSTSDTDAGDTHSYTVDDARFEVVGTSLQLRTGETLDFETEPTVTLQVTSTDAGALSITQQFTVSVDDLNETPSAIALDSATIAENTEAVIGVLSTSDTDAGDAHTYTVDDARFEVVGNNLQLRAGETLDFESEPTVIVQVTSKDSGDLAITQEFTIGVEDVNETPTAIGLDNAVVAENTDGATVGLLATTDADAGDSHTYSVADSRFEVQANTLKLRDGQTLDHESEPTVALQLTSTDSANNTVTTTFTVQVTDTNEAPSLIVIDNATVNENLDAGTVGTLTTTDVDAADSHTYTVDDTRFEIVADRLQLRTGQTLDHETEPTVTLQITTTDNGGLSLSQSITITVGDLNEAPTAIAIDNSFVSENSVGAIIGDLTTTDADTADSHNYTVSDNRFEVDGNSLRLRTGESVDF
ncbi:DUF2341 domain-containing protein, partial [bacterium]|nr:DUF2341 domain-containing protein [bacterium]